MSGLDDFCVGHGSRQPHVPAGGLHVARITPYGAEVRLCRDCLRAWQDDDDGGDR